MGRFSIFFGILSILVAVAMMILLFAVEDVQFVEDLMVQLHCEEGETSITTAQRLNFSGTQNSTTVFYCTNNENIQREITGRMGLTIAVSFALPLLLGMMFIFGGAFRLANKQERNLAKRFNNYEVYGGQAINLTSTSLSPAQLEQVQQVLQTLSGSMEQMDNPTLADRLQQLEEARNQRLISSAEYERTRQAILDSMDDNL